MLRRINPDTDCIVQQHQDMPNKLSQEASCQSEEKQELSALKDSADKGTAVPLLGKHMIFMALEARSRTCGSGVENLTPVPRFTRQHNPLQHHLISSPYLSYLCSKQDKQILSAYILPHAFSLPPKPHPKSKAATFSQESHIQLLNFKQSSFFCKFFCFNVLTWVTEYARDSTVVIASTRFTLDLLSR